MDSKILVTGATGFIGGNVVGALVEAGYRVRAIHRPKSRMRALGDLLERYSDEIESVHADLKQPETLSAALDGCDAVIHCAGYFPTVSLYFAQEVEKARQQMRDLLEAARRAGVERFVYTSGLSTVGAAEVGTAADESCYYHPGSVLDPYYEAKWQMERQCIQADREDFATVALLPTLCVGPGDANRTVFKPFQLTAMMSAVAYFPGCANFVDVRVVARAHVAALERGRGGHRYILGGVNTDFREYFRCLARHLGVRRILVPIPTSLGVVMSWASEVYAVKVSGRPPLLPIENVNMARHGQHYDSSKARRELGLATTDLDNAVAEAVAWYRDKDYL